MLSCAGPRELHSSLGGRCRLPLHHSLTHQFILLTRGTKNLRSPGHGVVAFASWREAWKLSDGNSTNHWRLRRGERPPLSDEGARRVIKEREIYERQLRKAKGQDATIGKRWISRTPDEMHEFLADGKWQWRWRRRYTRTVEGAINVVRQLAQLPPEAINMRKVLVLCV